MSALDKLQQGFKAGNQLGQASTEEIGQLAGAAEQPVLPTNPLQGTTLGANPDQAKMLGTPANKLNALRYSIRQSMDQGTASRRNEAQVMDAQAQKDKADRAAQLQQLAGTLDGRVQALAISTLNAQQGTESGLRLDPSATAGVPAESQAEFTQLMGKVGNGTVTGNDLARLNAILGNTEVGSQLTAQALKSKFMSGSTQLGDALKAGLADSMKASELDMSQLAPGGKADVATLLGMTEEEIDEMTVTDLLGAVQTKQQADFTATQRLQDQATSPLLGQAQRAEARAALRGEAAGGALSAEDSIKDIQQQLDTANTVQIGQDSVPVEKLLSDEYLSGLVKSFLDDPASSSSAALRADSPDLVEWIETNRAGLEQLTAGIDKASADFSALQETNKKLVQPADPDYAGPAISQDALKQIIPDWGNLRGEAYSDATLPAIVNFAKNSGVPASIRAGVVDGLNKLATKYPQYAKEMGSLTPADIYQMGLDKPGAMQNYVDFLDNSAYLQMADTSTPAALLSSVGIGPESEQQLTELRRMQSLGIGSSESSTLLDILDPDGDGKIAPDQLDKMKGGLQEIFKAGSVKELLTRDKAGNLPTISKLASGLKAQPTDINAFRAMQDVIRDGDAGYDETKQAAQQLNYGQLESLYSRLQNNPLIKGDGAKALADAGTDKAYESARGALPYALRGGDGQEFGHWGNRVKSGQTLPNDVKKLFEESINRLNAASSSGTMFERAGADKLRRALDDTLSKSNELLRQQEDKARADAKAESDKERDAVRRELERSNAQLSAQLRNARTTQDAQAIQREIDENNTLLSGRWK